MKVGLGRALVALGVLAWFPYFGLKWFTEVDPPMAPFLALHLIGVIGGGWLTGGGWIRRLLRKD
ncbi:MAG: hypothetical protein WD906_05935 [Anaerolineales bacterium]